MRGVFLFFIVLISYPVNSEIYEVESSAELQFALSAAAKQGNVNTISLKAGIYETAKTREGIFFYESDKQGSLELRSQSGLQDVVLKGTEKYSTLELFVKSEDFKLNIQNIRFENAGDSAISIDGARLVTIRDSFFKNNRSPYSAGALRLSGNSKTNLLICNSEFIKNSSSASGGAINLENVIKAKIINTKFSENTAQNNGGALALFNTPEASIFSTSFERNSAGQGGAIYGENDIQIVDSQFTENDGLAGAAVNSLGQIAMYSSSVTEHISGDTFEADNFNFWHNNIINSAGNYSRSGGSNYMNNLYVESDISLRTADSIINNIISNTAVKSSTNTELSNANAKSNLMLEGQLNETILNPVRQGFIESDTQTGVSDLQSAIATSLRQELVDAGSDPTSVTGQNYNYLKNYVPEKVGSDIDIGPIEYDGSSSGSGSSEGKWQCSL